jgi:septal ring factor EnvC (AmiA/AmiB activator)
MLNKNQYLAIIAVTLFGLWGCSKATTDPTSAEKVKSLEAKIAKLEDEYRSALSQRDQIRKKLTLIEEDATKLNREITNMQKSLSEKDEIIKLRTTERDFVRVEYDGFRNSLRELINKADENLKPKTEGRQDKGSPSVPVGLVLSATK